MVGLNKLIVDDNHLLFISIFSLLYIIFSLKLSTKPFRSIS